MAKKTSGMLHNPDNGERIIWRLVDEPGVSQHIRFDVEEHRLTACIGAPKGVPPRKKLVLLAKTAIQLVRVVSQNAGNGNSQAPALMVSFGKLSERADSIVLSVNPGPAKGGPRHEFSDAKKKRIGRIAVQQFKGLRTGTDAQKIEKLRVPLANIVLKQYDRPVSATTVRKWLAWGGLLTDPKPRRKRNP